MGPSDPFRNSSPGAATGPTQPEHPSSLRPGVGFLGGAIVAACMLHFGLSDTALVLGAGGLGWIVVGVVAGHLDIRGGLAALLRRRS